MSLIMDVPAHHYYAAKRAAPASGVNGVEPTPRWLTTLPQIYHLTEQFSILLDQLPAVRATQNSTTIKNYFKMLVAELVKIYVYRLRLIELSDTIDEKDKPTMIDRLLEECRAYITTLAELVNYGDTTA